MRSGLYTGLAFALSAGNCLPQQTGSGGAGTALSQPAQPTSDAVQNQTGTSAPAQADASKLPGAPVPAQQQTPPLKPQPKRILGLMPNYRPVSAGVKPPPPTPKEAFMIATQNSFDYSAFVFVGITSLLAEGDNSHPQLGKGVGGFWTYYWRGYLDKTDGNYMVDFAIPAVLHQDERSWKTK